MGVLIMIAQMIAALTILVTIHEFGHYITAKWFGVQVDKFFVFFDAWGKKLFSYKKGETEYGIGWVPLGGYVKLGGMIDESMDKDWEEIPRNKQFRFKPAWQKLIIMLAGIFLNVVLGCLIYIGLNALNKKVIPLDQLKSNYVISDYAKQLGMQKEDEIIGANGKEMMRLEDVRKDIFFGGTVQVMRNGAIKSIDIPEDYFQTGESLVYLKNDMIVASIEDGSNAEKGGLAVDDKIVAIDGKPIIASQSFTEILQNKTGNEVLITVDRSGNKKSLTIPVDKEGKIGFAYQSMLDKSYEPLYTQMNISQAINYGIKDAFDMIFLNAKAFALMGKGKIKPQDSLAGPGQIAMMFGAQWNWVRFWTLTGTLSMILAFMNLLPIPALDGGHAVFAIIEMITGKPVNDKVLEVAQIIGFFLIMALMVFILGNDAVKIGSKIFGN